MRDSKDYDKWELYSVEDYNDALLLYENGRYRNAAYLLQQSCEKYFKFLFLLETGNLISGHSLEELSKRFPKIETLQTKEVKKDLVYLTSFVSLARYPTDDIKYDQFTKAKDCADRVLRALKEYSRSKYNIEAMNLFNNN